MLDRESLEKLALELVSADLYYELLDCMAETSDAELLRIIEVETENKLKTTIEVTHHV